MKLRLMHLILLAGLVLILGCGYHLAGTQSTLPPHLKTIAIPVFDNTSSEPEIHRDLTNIIRQSFISDGRLKVVDEKNADLLMKGKLHYYSLRAVSFSSTDVASEYYVELGVEVDVNDEVKKKRFLKQSFTTKWDFRSTSDVINSEASRQTALNDAYRELGNRLVSTVVDQF